jgi:hypothetical protein
MPRSLLAFQLPNITTDTGNKAKFKSVVSADPAANAESTITVPASTYYKIVSASINCVQGATQTPLPALVISDASGNVVGSFNAASAAISAATTSRCNWFPGAVLTAGAAATQNNAPIPDDLIIGPSFTVTTVTAGKGANTDLGVLALLVTELKP